MKDTQCGLTKLLLLIALGGLVIGWYRDVCGSGEREVPSNTAAGIAGQMNRSRTGSVRGADDECAGGRAVPKGMRLVSVRYVRWRGPLEAGDRVDVVRSTGKGGRETFLENVQVWSTVELAHAKAGAAPATLLLSEADALKLAEHLPAVTLAPREAAF